MILIITCLLMSPTAFAYTDVDDSFDFDDVVKHPDIFRAVVDCFIDVEPCTPVMQKFKDHEYEAVNDACNECNRRQLHTFILFVTAMEDILPEEFALYQKKYDPDGTKIPKLKKKLKDYLTN